MEDWPVLYMVVQAAIPQQIGKVQFCGEAYAIFSTKEEALAWQKAHNMESFTRIVET